MRDRLPIRRTLLSRTADLIESILSMLVDAVFLAMWVGTQYGISLLVNAVSLSQLDSWVLQAFQLIFAISTLIPVLVYVLKDLILIVLIAKHSVADASAGDSHAEAPSEGTWGDPDAS